MFQIKEKDKTHRGDRQSPWKRIHSNDSKDDPRIEKRMHAQTKKLQEMFSKEQDLKKKHIWTMQ